MQRGAGILGYRSDLTWASHPSFWNKFTLCTEFSIYYCNSYKMETKTFNLDIFKAKLIWVTQFYGSGILGYLSDPTHQLQNSFYRWSKISSLEITIFYLKRIVKSGLDFLFWNSPSPFRVAAAQCKNICLNWCHLVSISKNVVFYASLVVRIY